MHAGSNTMNYMTDKERGQNIQFLILPSTIEHFLNKTANMLICAEQVLCEPASIQIISFT